MYDTAGRKPIDVHEGRSSAPTLLPEANAATRSKRAVEAASIGPGGGRAPGLKHSASSRRCDHSLRRIDEFRLLARGAFRGVDARVRTESVADVDADRLARS